MNLLNQTGSGWFLWNMSFQLCGGEINICKNMFHTLFRKVSSCPKNHQLELIKPFYLDISSEADISLNPPVCCDVCAFFFTESIL